MKSPLREAVLSLEFSAFFGRWRHIFCSMRITRPNLVRDL